MLTLIRSNYRVELSAFVNRNVGWDACSLTNVLVILTVGRCLVHNSGAIGIGNIICNQDLPSVSNIKQLSVRVEVKDALVLQTVELSTHIGLGDSSLYFIGRFVAEFLGIAANQGSRHQVACRSILGRSNAIFDLWTNRECEVGRQCPGGSRPSHQVYAIELVTWAGNREGDADRLVLAVFVNLVVHTQFVVGKWSFTSPAISQNLEALVYQAFFVELLECPKHALGVVGVQSLVVIIKINPARLAGDIGSPVLGVLQDRGLAELVELGNTKLLNLRSTRDSKQAFCLNFGRKTVSVPTKAALDAITAHGLVSRD